VVETEPAAPLGSFPYGTCPEHELTLAGGETLVLYTDGLIERPAVPLDTSIDQLVEVLTETSSAESACELAVDAFIPLEGLRDDIAIIALENGDVPEKLRLRLPADATELSRMRRGLRRWLRNKGALEPDVSEITIAVNEACANAIEHAYSPSPARFSLEASVENGVVTILVMDQGAWREPRGEARGRGLTIVRTAMDEVEIITDDRGTTVWMRRRLGAR
jgi:anti-sigma regulatory factor (Ser/Thr protein kinase)